MSNELHPVRHGFYQVGNLSIANKIDAIVAAEKLNSFPKFIFNDEAYCNHDWSKEPEESLETLYAQRAWDLRQRYDYLVLHFSGGSDSTNILETFIRNNIPLDEIFIRGPWKAADKNINNRHPANQHAEAWFCAWPLANWAKDTHYPHLKITVTDTTQYIADYFTHNPGWHEKCTISALLPGVVWKSEYDMVEQSYRTLQDKGFKIAHVLGIEKPMIFWENQKYHVKFLDRFINIMLGQRCTDTANPFYNVEAFYWSDTTAKLIAKQAHTVKNYIKDRHLDPSVLSSGGRSYHDWLAGIIYQRTLPLYFTTEKSPYQSLLMDQWFFQDSQSAYLKNFRQGVESLITSIPDRWVTQNQFTSDLVGIWSRSYDLGS